ncbi:MAG: nuclear transport factor 2 family protein [Ignavibacteriaceae bacterium]|jgi:ketosteroid isomerase-like protein
MSERNKHLIKRIMDAISRENGNFYLDHLAEDMKWNIVGMPVIEGKKEVLESIKELHLENFNLSKIKNIVAEGEFVVVESIGKTTGNYFCDIYQIKYDKIQELTSYIVDTSSIESAGDIKREIFYKQV